jgi:hypothetical protein
MISDFLQRRLDSYNAEKKPLRSAGATPGTASRNDIDIRYTYEGLSVSLSADGKTLAAGAPYYNDDFSGATQIYVNLPSGWAHQTTLSQKVPWAYEGRGIDMSADTSTIAIGAEYLNSTGGTFVYVN